MTEFEKCVLESCEKHCSDIYAWCILPNHYHLLMRTAEIDELRKDLGQLHGRTSFLWNGEITNVGVRFGITVLSGQCVRSGITLRP